MGKLYLLWWLMLLQPPRGSAAMAGSSPRAFSSTPLSAWLKTTPAAASVVCGASGSASGFLALEEDQKRTVKPVRLLQNARPARLKNILSIIEIETRQRVQLAYGSS
jgi:hypothetical protein